MALSQQTTHEAKQITGATALTANGQRLEAPDAMQLLDSREDHIVLCAKILQQARDDLKRPRSCSHFQSAVSWIIGRYPCGCRYAEAGASFEDVCRALFSDATFVHVLRERLLRGVKVPRMRQCRDPESKSKIA